MIVLFIFFFSYLVFVLLLNYSWRRIPESIFIKRNMSTNIITVIIPVRNERENILYILNDLEIQSLEKELYEVIVVDDHSTDGTSELLLQHINSYNFSIQVHKLDLPNDFDGSFKKRAIAEAIKISKGNIILTTDGDCRVGPKWIESYYNVFSETKVVMVSGVVTFYNEGSWFEKLQTLEFASLIGAGGATIQLGYPSMCNGANLAYLKSAYEDVEGFQGVEHFHSGDDEFLMHKIHNMFPGKIIFLKNKDCIVLTKAKKDFFEFIHQRKRWAGKWKFYTDFRNIFLAAFVFIFHVVFIMTLLLFSLKIISPIFFCILMIMKLLPEFLFLKAILKFMEKKFVFNNFLFLGWIYSFYAVFFGIIANFGSYEWKNRKLKNA
jgi:cellulose synthase/poly-beta-1,6-N-acetylglucosamine synthase-like glycosyltransferase